MMYALRTDFACVSPHTLLRGMAIATCEITKGWEVLNSYPAKYPRAAPALIFNQKANIGTGDKRNTQHTTERKLLPAGKRLWGYLHINKNINKNRHAEIDPSISGISKH